MSHPAFTCLRRIPIASLNLTVEEYRHLATGARHLHLVAEDDNNAFLVAFLTVPENSTGVAHILEHTSLCGSAHYPVRDPFFMMTRRSLNTFMNAFTSSDWTAYPFASCSDKDFENLLHVYLDAVFFPCLDPLDFAQEGHRLEFTVPDDPTTPLTYKGVVFNEMKGALSSPNQILWHTVHEHLFPTTTYHHNSGGNPQAIPNLTHAQLQAFHANHYHPSNAIFMTYGDCPAEQHQQVFETHALKHFQALNVQWRIPPEQRYSAPINIVSHYGVGEQEELTDKTHIVLAWLLGDSTDSRAMMNITLLTGILLDNSASPLRHALETTPLATAPSPLCGFDESTSEANFVCGVEGSNPEHAEAIEHLILQVLEKVATQGVPQSQVESVLHQIELSQREISGDHLPYGLNLLLNALTPMIHGGDPIDALDLDPVLTALRTDIQNPDFVPTLVKQLLLDNPHRIRVVMAPDPQLNNQDEAEEAAKLTALHAAMSEVERQKIIAQAAALQARQQTKDNPELLPKVGLEDVPPDLKIPVSTANTVAASPVTWFVRGTNGLVYQAIAIDLPELEQELVDILPLFCECLTETGCGDKSYLETAEWQAAVTGGVNARISLRSSTENLRQGRCLFVLSGKALVRNQNALTELLQATLEQARFDEIPRLRELIGQARTEQDNNIAQRAHHLAMTTSTSCISPTGAMFHHWYGATGLQRLRKLDDSIKKNEAALTHFASQLQRILHKIATAPRQFLIISEAEHQEHIAQGLQQRWSASAPQTTVTPDFQLPPVAGLVKQTWRINTQVNFCAKAYRTVPSGHVDAPPLLVLGDFLRNGYLHTTLRERGGAYGGGAHYNGDTGAFNFYSYRDPRLTETLSDFNQALVWLQNTTHEPRSVEEAILGVISRIDRPGSPAGSALNTFFGSLHGRTPEQRRKFRKQVLEVTLEDLQRVAATYLQPENAHIAVFGNGKKATDLTELGLEGYSL